MTRRIKKRPEGSSQTKVINFDERGGEERQAAGRVLTIRDVLANLSLCLLRKLSKPTLSTRGIEPITENMCWLESYLMNCLARLFLLFGFREI